MLSIDALFPRYQLLHPACFLSTPCMNHPFLIRSLHRAVDYLEDDLIVRDVVQDILGHTVMNQSGNGLKLLFGQRLSILCPDQVGLTSLHPLHMAIQVAHLSDIRGLRGPGGDGTDAGQDNEKVESLLGCRRRGRGGQQLDQIIIRLWSIS